MMRWSILIIITLRMNPISTCLVQWHDQTFTISVPILVECHEFEAAKDFNDLDAKLRVYLNTPPTIHDFALPYANWCNSSKKERFGEQPLLQPIRSKPHPNRDYNLTVWNRTRFGSVSPSSYRNIPIASWRSTRKIIPKRRQNGYG